MSLRSYFRDQLISGERLVVEELAEEHFDDLPLEEAKVRVQSAIVGQRRQIEAEQGRLLICRFGSYRLLAPDEKREHLIELQIRSERAKSVVEGYAQSVRLTTKYVPSERKAISMNVADFKQHMMKISGNLLPGGPND